ncbi:hypothetical protein MNBD_GAMMA09-1267 [hydrothermal vent metagenome]|uniref:Uncharacterized protein n=1 Tax=hydrothermal vent metagenome TaxID=652676 RepID=A0A3B0X0V5_9ZZZZ
MSDFTSVWFLIMYEFTFNKLNLTLTTSHFFVKH